MATIILGLPLNRNGGCFTCRMAATAKILMGRDGNVATFKIVGVGTFQSAVGFKATYTELLADGVRDFVLDLGECALLDSTFLGIILGLALKVRQLKPPGQVHIVNANEMLLSLFRGTGLDQIFEMNERGLADGSASSAK